MNTDWKNFRLGKHPARRDARTLEFATYRKLAIANPPAPAACDWTPKVHAPGFLQWTWPMLANDKIGDCTCAAAGHLIECWSANAQAGPGPNGEFCPSDDQVIAAYSAITGYNPNDPSTDNGANELDVLNYWRTNGIGGRKISAFVALSTNFGDGSQAEVCGYLQELKESIAWLGGAYLGLGLPLSAQQAGPAPTVWDVVTPTPTDGSADFGSWGGHAVPAVAYDATGVTVITWGQVVKMTWAFYSAYCDEAYAVLSPDWLEATGHAPSGLSLADLEKDLGQLSN